MNVLVEFLGYGMCKSFCNIDNTIVTIRMRKYTEKTHLEKTIRYNVKVIHISFIGIVSF